ncbi:MAG: alpha/beta hydrolase [Woeseia sp.]
MRRVSVPIAAFALMTACVILKASAQETVSDPGKVMDLKWEIGPWTDIWRIARFESKAVGGDVSFYVYLPPGYETGGKSYPVVYWLHGAYERPYSATPVAKRLDAAIRAGDAVEMILVSCIDPTGLSMWVDSKDGRLPMETLIIEELIPYVDGNYRTIAERRGRAIEGFSMGGYGAAYLGIRYRQLFSSVSVLAGALHTPETLRARRRAIFENVFGGDPGYARERSPWRVLEAAAENIRGKTSMRVFVGADDLLLDWNRNYHSALDDLAIEHQWGIVPDSPHNLEILMQNWQGDFFEYYRRVFGDTTSGVD